MTVAEAEALIDRIHRLPGPQSAREMGTDAAQAALALIAKANRAANRKDR